MALYKDIKQDDGIITKYHRILYLTHTVNSHNSIAIVSYTDRESRDTDIVSENRPYRKAITYEIDYDENMTIESAYNYLKTLPEFEGATDI